MTKEEVNKLYIKIILEYGVKSSVESILSHNIIRENNVSLSNKRDILSKKIEYGKLSTILNNIMYHPSYMEAITTDHLFAILTKLANSYKGWDFFDGQDLSAVINIFNDSVDFETNGIKQEKIEELKEKQRKDYEEREYWRKVRNGEIQHSGFDSIGMGDGSTLTTAVGALNNSLDVYLNDDDEEGYF